MRNKIVVLAAIGLGVFFLMPGETEEEVSNNSWAVQAKAPSAAQAGEGGFIDGLVTEAGDFLDERGISPAELADEQVGRLDSAADAYKQANP